MFLCRLTSTGLSIGVLSEWDQTFLFERSCFSLMASVSRLHWHFPCFAISKLFISTCILMTASDCFPLLSLVLFWLSSWADETWSLCTVFSLGLIEDTIYLGGYIWLCVLCQSQHRWAAIWVQQFKGYQDCLLINIPCLYTDHHRCGCYLPKPQD